MALSAHSVWWWMQSEGVVVVAAWNHPMGNKIHATITTTQRLYWRRTLSTHHRTRRETGRQLAQGKGSHRSLCLFWNLLTSPSGFNKQKNHKNNVFCCVRAVNVVVVYGKRVFPFSSHENKHTFIFLVVWYGTILPYS
jgi:hypothetical protein